MAIFSSPAPPTSLVLLPSKSSQPVSSALLSAALRHAKQLGLQEHGTRTRRRVLAALPLSSLTDGSGAGARPRAHLFAEAQAAVAETYRAACAAAQGEGVEVAADLSVDDDEDAGQDGSDPFAVDVGVVLVAFDPTGEAEREERGWFGPVVSVAGLARRRGWWEAVWAAEQPEGEPLRRRFEALADGVAVRRVPVPAQSTTSADAVPQRGEVQGDAGTRCKSVAVGGTFDHLHVGHKLLLTMTAFAVDAPWSGDDAPQEDRMITVGMTAADLLAKKKFAEVLQPWHTRTKRAHAFLRAILRPDEDGTDEEQVEEVHAPGPNGHAIRVRLSPRGGGPVLVLNYVEIWDPFGPTITDARIDTLVVSAETRGGGKAVNEKRKEVGMAEVVVCEVDVLDALTEDGPQREGEGFEDKLSSTEIRRGVMERRIRGRSKV
jgi:phosphopantetheine adenylyltransferase